MGILFRLNSMSELKSSVSSALWAPVRAVPKEKVSYKIFDTNFGGCADKLSDGLAQDHTPTDRT